MRPTYRAPDGSHGMSDIYVRPYTPPPFFLANRADTQVRPYGEHSRLGRQQPPSGEERGGLSRLFRVVGHFDQVPVGVSEIKRADRPRRAALVTRAFDDLHAAAFDVRHRLAQIRFRDEAHVLGTRNGRVGLGFELRSRLMEVDFLLTEPQRATAPFEGDDLHAENRGIKLARALHVAHGEHHVVETIYLQGRLLNQRG